MKPISTKKYFYHVDPEKTFFEIGLNCIGKCEDESVNDKAITFCIWDV